MFLSVVVSVFNESAVLPRFLDEISAVIKQMPHSVEVIFVNDGSRDNSLVILEDAARSNKNFKIINLSRNFGHEAAMIAGIDHSSGDAVICMDADMQHPIVCIPAMLEALLQGNEVVLMTRSENKDTGLIKRCCNYIFYTVMNKLSPQGFIVNASDFFLISRRVVHILNCEFRERVRFLRGYIQIVGFKTKTLEFVAEKRWAGTSKYSSKKLFDLAVNALFIFSNVPLRLGLMLSLVVGGFSIIVGIYSIIMKFIGDAPSGYTTIVALISFLFAIQFLLIGIIGEYIGYIFLESKKRPIYIVDATQNMEGNGAIRQESHKQD
jgi:dolichol-phosphate mannosyltransferase